MSLKSAALAGVVLALAAAPALAQQAVTWVEGPTVTDLAAAYPAKARVAGTSGAANLTCTIGRDGHPRDCFAIGEQPSGMGFGFAARKLAEKLRIGEAGMTGKEVRIPVTFDPLLANGEAVIRRPAWQVLPSAADFQASFPQTANGVNEVRVVLACTVAAGGTLQGCAVDREEPAGQGYGAGALALAPKFRVGPWSQDGEPTVGAKLRVPIRYQLTQVAPPKS